MIGGFAPKAFAIDPPLVVHFENEPQPLFNEANFAPGNEVLRTVEVANNSGSSKNIIVEAINGVDTGGLGSKLNLVIKEGAATRYTGTLGAFLSSAGEVLLSPLSSGSNTTYSFGVTFDSNAENNLQNKTLGFDLCVGFKGGETHCGTTVISDENGGGGSSGGSMPLIISNEQALNITNVDASSSTIITWNTNKLATSQVVYGLASGTYTLYLNAPHFGYTFSNTEDSNKVMNHGMVLTGLTPGATYKYRVVSRASPATVSYEHQFTVPMPTEENNLLVLGGNIENGTSEEQGDVQGANSENNGSETSPGNIFGNDGEVEGASNSNLATALGSGFGNILSTCNLIALLILVLIYLIWKLWLRKRYEKSLIGEEKIRTRFYVFFGGATLLAILVFIIFRIYCPLPIFALVFIISVCVYIYRKLRVR